MLFLSEQSFPVGSLTFAAPWRRPERHGGAFGFGVEQDEDLENFKMRGAVVPDVRLRTWLDHNSRESKILKL